MFSAVASDLSTVQIVPSQSCGCGCAGDNCVVLPILAVELVVTDLPVVVHRKPRVGDFYFRAAYASQMFFFFSYIFCGVQSECTLGLCCVINRHSLKWSASKTCAYFCCAAVAACSVKSHLNKVVS